MFLFFFIHISRRYFPLLVSFATSFSPSAFSSATFFLFILLSCFNLFFSATYRLVVSPLRKDSQLSSYILFHCSFFSFTSSRFLGILSSNIPFPFFFIIFFSSTFCILTPPPSLSPLPTPCSSPLLPFLPLAPIPCCPRLMFLFLSAVFPAR